VAFDDRYRALGIEDDRLNTCDSGGRRNWICAVMGWVGGKKNAKKKIDTDP
jgi:hypothetical protein